MLEEWLREIAPEIEVYKGYIVKTPDGTLYLGRGEHEVFAHKLGKLKVSPASFADFDANLADRKAYTSKRGIRYIHAIAPDKDSVVTEPLRALKLRSFIDLYRRNCKQSFLDLRPDTPIAGAFYRTDSHWALPLQMDAALRIVRALGVGEAEITAGRDLLVANTTPTPHEFCGDLGTQLEPRETEMIYAVQADWMKTYSIAGVGGWNDGMVRIYRNACGPQRRLLIFGDSFGHSLCIHLLPFFSDILFCRTGYFHKEMVDMMCPTHVLTQQAERFLNSSLRDAEAKRFLLIPFINGSEIGAGRDYWAALNDVLTPPKPPRLTWLQHVGLGVDSVRTWLAAQLRRLT